MRETRRRSRVIMFLSPVGTSKRELRQKKKAIPWRFGCTYNAKMRKVSEGRKVSRAKRDQSGGWRMKLSHKARIKEGKIRLWVQV